MSMARRGTVPRLLLHVGAPKTGSTSIQVFLHDCHDRLKGHGVLYPRLYVPDVPDPKHQWLVGSLLRQQHDRFRDHLRAVRAEVSDAIHTVVLSTEGLYNHWGDLSSEAKQALQGLQGWFQVQVIVFLREPLAFAVSLYKQYCCNPSSATLACYGRDMTFDEALLDPWFAAHLDYAGFVEDAERLFGPGSVTPIQYEREDVIAVFRRLLAFAEPCGDAVTPRNVSLGRAGLELVRVVNRYPLDPDQKRKAVRLVREIEQLIGHDSGTFAPSAAAQARVAALSARSRATLAQRFAISW